MPPTPDATILFTTKNRVDELRRAVASACAQTARCEVLVIDDGSTDGTADAITHEFPSVRVIRHERSEGYIVRRNEGVAAAQGPVVFSLDDDAAFSDPQTVARTLPMFDHPRVGVVQLPYIDVLKSDVVIGDHRDGPGVWVASEFRGTAHALRRDVFLALGGFRAALIHQGEETDYAYRLLEAGLVVRAVGGAPIHHFESPKRDLTRQVLYSVRNNVLIAWWNVPWPHALARVPGTAARTLISVGRQGYPRAGLRGVGQAIGAVLAGPVARRPVSTRTHALFVSLRRARALPLSAIEDRLAPLPTLAQASHGGYVLS